MRNLLGRRRRRPAPAWFDPSALDALGELTVKVFVTPGETKFHADGWCLPARTKGLEPRMRTLAEVAATQRSLCAHCGGRLRLVLDAWAKATGPSAKVAYVWLQVPTEPAAWTFAEIAAAVAPFGLALDSSHRAGFLVAPAAVGQVLYHADDRLRAGAASVPGGLPAPATATATAAAATRVANAAAVPLAAVYSPLVRVGTMLGSPIAPAADEGLGVLVGVLEDHAAAGRMPTDDQLDLLGVALGVWSAASPWAREVFSDMDTWLATAIDRAVAAGDRAADVADVVAAVGATGQRAPWEPIDVALATLD